MTAAGYNSLARTIHEITGQVQPLSIATLYSAYKPQFPLCMIHPMSSDPVLDAQNLCRQLSSSAAVSDISLSLRRGDILGLLGLNGAGKSTTLRMLSGLLVPDSGNVHINGQNLHEAPLEARAQLGFLPDQPPLYNDMRVHEYLRLAGRIRGLTGNSLKQGIDRVVNRCNLAQVHKQMISSLSKGFRQRVGLAQAIIHDPAVVLLDEPSNGLDPQQLEDMRNLIIDLGQNQAVVFSTHLLSEAQASCNRIAIIHEGRLVADAPANGNELAAVFNEAIQ